MRVLHVSNSPYPSLEAAGPTLRILTELARDADEYHVLAYTGTRRWANDRMRNIQLHALPLRRAAEFAPGSIAAAPLLAVRHRIDVIVAQDPLLGGVAAVIAGGMVKSPVLLEVHTDVYFDPRTAVQRRAASGALWALRRAHGVRAVGPIARDHLLRLGIPASRVSIVPYRVDTEVFMPRTNIATVRASLGIPRDAVVLVSAGRFVPQKGLELLIDAFGLIAAKHPSCHLALIGDGPLGDALRTRAEIRGVADRIHFPGWLPQPAMAELFSACDVYVQPSVPGLGDWMPRTILEAMSSGVPVVAASTAGIPDVVTPNVGLLVDPGDASKLAEALARLVEDSPLRTSLAREARAEATAQYEWSRSFDTYRELVQNLAAGGRS